MKHLINIIIIITIITVILTPPVFAQAATLSLSPSSGTFNKGCTFSLDIVLDTGGVQTDGTDAIVFYDTTRFQGTSITSGTIYPDYPGNNIDTQAGKITVSGLASVTQPYSGKGTLATINFRVLDNAPAGSTQMKFDFDPNDKAKTTDSNVVERGTIADVLSSVVNGGYTVGTGTCPAATPTPKPGISAGAPGVSTPSATIAPSPAPKPTLPPAGTQELTYTLTIVGFVFVILGILGLALL